MMERMTVNDIYRQCQLDGTKMLSENNATFWKPYLLNHEPYDRYFRNKYSEFFYIYRYDTSEKTKTEFVSDVDSILTVGAKRYDELFRMQLVDDKLYDILNNYDVTETMSKSMSGTGDSKTDATTDSRNTEKSETRSGSQGGSETTELGETNATATTKNPHTETTTVNSVSAYDKESFANRDKSVTNVDAHNIETDTHTESRTDKLTRDLTSNDTLTGTGTETDSIGARHTATTSAGTEEWELKRKGNIGVMTQSDILEKHLRLWDSFSFYDRIFNDIRNQLLLVANPDCIVPFWE